MADCNARIELTEGSRNEHGIIRHQTGEEQPVVRAIFLSTGEESQSHGDCLEDSTSNTDAQDGVATLVLLGGILGSVRHCCSQEPKKDSGGGRVQGRKKKKKKKKKNRGEVVHGSVGEMMISAQPGREMFHPPAIQ